MLTRGREVLTRPNLDAPESTLPRGVPTALCGRRSPGGQSTIGLTGRGGRAGWAGPRHAMLAALPPGLRRAAAAQRLGAALAGAVAVAGQGPVHELRAAERPGNAAALCGEPTGGWRRPPPCQAPATRVDVRRLPHPAGWQAVQAPATTPVLQQKQSARASNSGLGSHGVRVRRCTTSGSALDRLWDTSVEAYVL